MRPQPQGAARRVVVLRALNLGDLLTGVPALRAVRAAYPDHHVTLAAPAAFAPLVRREDLADAVSDSHELAPLDPALAAPDVAVDLHGRGPGSQPLLLALAPRRLVAFAHPSVPETRGMPEWHAGEHEVRRWCRLLNESGIPASPELLGITPPPTALPADVRGATIIHPGAAAASRRWPPARWAEVAAHEVASGRRVVVTGSPHEVGLAKQVAALARPAPVAVWAGRTSLDDLITAVAGAGRVLSADTGVAHVAFATGTPSITLYGPVPPTEWGPPPGRRRHRALWAGRRGDPHGPRLDPGLAALRIDDVVAAGHDLDAHLACCTRHRWERREGATT